MTESQYTEPGIFFLSQGEMLDGRPYWAYVLVPLDRVEAYQAAGLKGDLDLREYGTILHWGVGEEPPAEIKAEMEKNYKLQHDFVQKMTAELQKTKAGRHLIEVTTQHVEEMKKKAREAKPEESA